MIKSNYYEDNKDLQFIVKHCVDWEKIVPLKEKDYKDAKIFNETGDDTYAFGPNNLEEALENYQMVFEQYGELTGKEVSQVALEMDQKGLSFADGKVSFPEEAIKMVKLFIDSGFSGPAVGRKYGGLNLPFVAQSIIGELSSRADMAFGLIMGCFNLADVIEMFGDDEMKDKYIPKIAAGEWTSAMSLTEPNYGSDLPHLKAKAVKQDDGTYKISGTKRFITQACGIEEIPSAILTLARSSGEGAKGLSFFLVESKDIEVLRIEHKLGIHCSPTCEIEYDNSKAYLIGEEGKGLVKYAMEMMNGARLAIATQSTGICEAAYQEAKQFAGEREQFGKQIKDIPQVEKLLEEMNARTQAMRALTMKTSEIVDLYDGISHKKASEGIPEKSIRKDPEVAIYDKLARLLTPTSKMFNSEMSLIGTSDGLQVFGGSGFTEEYDLAKLYRDARITTIYEGTSQLQAMAAIGGINAGLKASGWLYEYLQAEVSKGNDGQVKDYLTKELKNSLSVLDAYRTREKEDKDKLPMHVVYYFAFLYTSILLNWHVKVAKDNNHNILAEKEQVMKTFIQMAKGEMIKQESIIRGEL